MKQEIVLKVENISKIFKVGEVTSGTLVEDFVRWWNLIRGKEDPLLKLADINDRTIENKTGYVKALDNINFELRRGEVLGIVGSNGAGKSTLLKILSKITSPSSGCIKIKGKIASLLEVGTGFHPRLTGRENIYLNGTIMGMTKKQIDKKMEKIIKFAGVEKFIDTPVKRYSSGMIVRLGFSVAAHLEPDILIIDEVLAVGDFSFQLKAIRKMKEICRSKERTIIFISHNMSSVEALCDRCLLLEEGAIKYDGSPKDTIDLYLKNNSNEAISSRKRKGRHNFTFTDLVLLDRNDNKVEDPKFGDPLIFRIFFKIHSEIIGEADISLDLLDENGVHLISMSNDMIDVSSKSFLRNDSFKYSLSKLTLTPGRYFVSLSCKDSLGLCDKVENFYSFRVKNQENSEYVFKSRFLADFEIL